MSLQGEKSPSWNRSTSEGRPQSWNTQNLTLRLASDFTAAASAGVLVAPIVTVIDKAIIENASGRNTLMASVKGSLRDLILRPHRFLVSKPFRLIFTLYTSTYFTANVVDTISSCVHNTDATNVTTGLTKFIVTSSINIPVCVYKDSRFAPLFGPLNVVPRAVPNVSYALFALRDSLTIFASFNVPPLLAPRLPFSQAFENAAVSRMSAAQFLAPALVQLISTPVHLLGLDFYNRPSGDVGWKERAKKVQVDWLKSSLARMCRIVPAFGFGGVVNTRARYTLIGSLKEADSME